MQKAFNRVMAEFRACVGTNINVGNKMTPQKRIAVVNFITSMKAQGIVPVVMEDVDTVERVATEGEWLTFAKNKANSLLRCAQKHDAQFPTSSAPAVSETKPSAVAKKRSNSTTSTAPPKSATKTPGVEKKKARVTEAGNKPPVKKLHPFFDAHKKNLK